MRALWIFGCSSPLRSTPRSIREKAAPYQQRGLSLRLISKISPAALKRCDLAIVASGTVTLEAAILGVPILIVYKVSPVNYWIANGLIHVPYVGLVNWVAGEKIIPEYIQDEAVPEALSAEALRLSGGPGITRVTGERWLWWEKNWAVPGPLAGWPKWPGR